MIMPFTPDKLRATVRASKEALGLDSIPLWQFHHANAYHADAPEYKALMVAAKSLVNSAPTHAFANT